MKNLIKKICNVSTSLFNKRWKIIVAIVSVFVIAGGITAFVLLNDSSSGNSALSNNTHKEKPSQSTPKTNNDLSADRSADYTKLVSTDDYKNIYDKLINSKDKYYSDYMPSFDYSNSSVSVDTVMKGESVNSSAKSSDFAPRSNSEVGSNVTDASSTDSTSDYATTNIQVEGVDEADIIKNDGNYLYCMKSGKNIRIIKADGTSLTKVSTIDTTASEFYILNDRLITIDVTYNYSYDYAVYRSSTDDSDIMQKNQVIDNNAPEKSFSSINIYDISDRTNPTLINTLKQDGYLVTSRVSDGFLYTLTCYDINSLEAQKECSAYIPCLNDTTIGANCICIPDDTYCESYMLISSVKIADCSNFTDSKAILSSCEDYYVSNNNIYCVNNEFFSSDNSSITKFKYKDGIIYNPISQELDGYVNDSFSLDEYNENLRVVTTHEVCTTSGMSASMYRTNKLTVFDSELNIVGSIDDIADGETIKSARFMGDTGYFVTYRNMDPLFAVDLSDPANPTILSELKITGFSSYLHPYSENLLLGIGYEINPNTQETLGIKLSMFDISNPSDVKECDKIVLPMKESYSSTGSSTYQYSYFDCSALYNHKSVMVDTKKNLFGFGVSDILCTEQYIKNTYKSTYNISKKYLAYTYDEEKGFVEAINYSDSESMDSQSYYMCNNSEYRGTYIGDYLYLIDENGEFKVLNYTSGEKIAEYTIE